MSNIPVALVTGGSRGIGRAAAEELAREGYKVALIARTPERLEAAARELVETLGLDAEHAPVTFALDVGDGQAVGDAVDRLAAEWGRIDVLFNSAGVSIPGTLELGADTLDLLYRTNLRAPFLFMKHVIPIMRRQGSGYIFNLASRNGKIGVIGTTATIGSGSYKREIERLDSKIRVYEQDCPLFVPLVENGFIRRDDPITVMVVEHYLGKLKDAGADTIILGCTHYPLLRDVISDVMGANTALIDSGRETALYAAKRLKEHGLQNTGQSARRAFRALRACF